MIRATAGPPSATSSTSRRPRSVGLAAIAGIAVFGLVLPACGGDDDAATETTTPTSLETTVAPTTLAATTTAVPTTTTMPPLELVTEGATLVVANASNVNGAAGRMSDALSAIGFSTGDPTNSSEGQLATTKIYYAPDDPAAKTVAESVRLALGGGAIELVELTVPAPTDTGEIGGATIVVAMGNDTADKSLDQLQGRVAPATTAPEDESSSEATSDTSADG